jgi:hypothetical protein
MAKKGEPPIEARLRALAGELTPEILELTKVRKGRDAKRVREALMMIEEAARSATDRMDPIMVPKNVFDPSMPDVAAWTVVLALVAQPRVKLAEVVPEYGAGVYALYYVGEHPLYASVSKTETPLYVGKADPEVGATRDVRTHKDNLTRRLLDHKRQIKMAEDFALADPQALLAAEAHPLLVADFECRKLVCASGVQLMAESRLIDLFRPLWNSRFSVAYGVSKHGDRRRKHPKSPWDVLHPGRDWADGLDDKGVPFPDQPTVGDIIGRIAAHAPSMRIFAAQEDVIKAVLVAFGQQPATAPPEIAEALEAQAEAEH